MNGRSGARRVRSRSRPRVISSDAVSGSESNSSLRPSHSPETTRCRALRASMDTRGEALENLPPPCSAYHDTVPAASPPSSGRRTPTSGFGPTHEVPDAEVTSQARSAASYPSEYLARSQLEADLATVAILRKNGALSHSLLEHITLFLNDREHQLDRSTSSQDVVMEATPEVSALSLPSRDPRIRRRSDTVPAPPAGPSITTIPLSATTSSSTTPLSGPSFADTLKTGATAAATTTASTSVPTPSKPRLPPLIVEEFPDWTRHFRAIKDLLGHAPNARPFGKGIRFTPSSILEYRIIQKYLCDLEKSQRLSWFSYALPSELSKKVAIRGLPPTTAPHEIIEALGEKGFQAEYVKPIRARMGRPGCVFFAVISNTPDPVPGIYEITELLYMSGITIESWRSKRGPAQCHRCQAFRHSSHGCHRRMACVRCGEEHFARDCPRPLEVPATCANCGGPHPANHSACPQFRREIRNRRAGTVAITAAKPVKKAQSITPIVANMVPAETQASSLMAPANPPTERGARMKKRGKGKKVHKEVIPPSSMTPHASVSPATISTHPAATTVAAPSSKLTSAQANQWNSSISINRALDTLKDVLLALREGRDPVRAVLEGMTSLLSNG